MAQETRHAAWQTERSFAVQLLPEGGPPTELASGLTEFLDAFDLASEWVSREDPGRDGGATLAIIETRDGVTAEVWSYPPAQPTGGQELIARLGFNPLTWVGVPEYSGDEQKSFLQQRVPSVAPSVAPSAPPPPPLPPVVFSEPEPEIDAIDHPPAPETRRMSIRVTVRAAWDDRVSRCCLIASGVTLWFSVGLADPQFLLPLLGFGPALWWRQRERASAPEPDVDDWL
jgi:hypothetical protein